MSPVLSRTVCFLNENMLDIIKDLFCTYLNDRSKRALVSQRRGLKKEERVVSVPAGKHLQWKDWEPEGSPISGPRSGRKFSPLQQKAAWTRGDAQTS